LSLVYVPTVTCMYNHHPCMSIAGQNKDPRCECFQPNETKIRRDLIISLQETLRNMIMMMVCIWSGYTEVC